MTQRTFELHAISRYRQVFDLRIDNPNDGPHDCDARCYPVSINGQIDAAVVLPEVEGYSPAQIEVIAGLRVRETLDIDDGDSLRLEIQ